MKRVGMTSGPLDDYIRSLHNGERFYATWVRDYLEDPQAPGDFDGPGTPWPAYPARWREEDAKRIAERVIRLYGEQESWRNDRRLESQRELSRIISEEARKDESIRRLEAGLRYGRNRRRGLTLTSRSKRARYRNRRR